MTLTNQAAPRGLPPGPRWPRAVQTLRFGLDPYGLFESAHRAFGDVFTLRVMAETWVILAHPDAVRELYRHGPDELDSGVANMSLRPLLGTQNVLLLDGGEHLRRRKLVLPPFHGERMLAYEELIREATRREVADWSLGVPMPTLPRMHAITLQVVLRAVFGLEEGARLDRLASSLRRLMTWTTDPRRGLVFGFLGPDRLMGLAGFRRQLAEVDGQLLAEIASRREAADLGDREDILSLLLRARDEDGEALSDRELRDELMTLLVAGHETTAAALSWALTEVARDPQAQARLADGEPGLAEAAITETLRLHPPVPLGSLRRLRGPMTIGRMAAAGGRDRRLVQPARASAAGRLRASVGVAGGPIPGVRAHPRARGCPSAAASAAASAPRSPSSKPASCSTNSCARSNCAPRARRAAGPGAAAS